MSTINDIGIPGVGTGILQPKLKHRWRLTFANLGGGADSQPLSLQATTITRPSFNFEEVQLDRYVSRAWIAGKYTFEPVSCTFEDDVAGTATRVIQDQVQQQQWLIGAQGPWLAAASEGSVYKFVTNMQMLDGNEQAIEAWTLEGCWIQSAEYGDGDYASSDAFLITLSIRYDHARQEVGGYGGDTRTGQGGQGVALGGQGRSSPLTEQG